MTRTRLGAQGQSSLAIDSPYRLAHLALRGPAPPLSLTCTPTGAISYVKHVRPHPDLLAESRRWVDMKSTRSLLSATSSSLGEMQRKSHIFGGCDNPETARQRFLLSAPLTDLLAR